MTCVFIKTMQYPIFGLNYHKNLLFDISKKCCISNAIDGTGYADIFKEDGDCDDDKLDPGYSY